MAVDLAHSSEAVVWDVLRVARRPVMISHTGAAGRCAGPRTLPEPLLRDVAAAGGVLGAGFWREVTCGGSVADVAASVEHLVRAVGARHVALGSDWDGAVAVPPGLDAAGVAQLTQALRDVGYDGDDLAAIMGGNALRALRAALPGSAPRSNSGA